MAEYYSMEMVKTSTGEIFYLGDNRSYWINTYLKERPELLPILINNKFIETKIINKSFYASINPFIRKALYKDRSGCASNVFDVFDKAWIDFPESLGKYFHTFKFYSDIYYVPEEYLDEFKNKTDFIYLKKIQVMHSMLGFIKINEGLYRERKREYFVYISSSDIYLVNSEFLNNWNIYKDQIHKNDHFILKEIIISGNSRNLLPYYSEVELVLITKGIYKVCKNVPDHIKKKYSPVPTWKIKPINIMNKNDYRFINPEFLCFKDIHGNEYLINIESMTDFESLPSFQHVKETFTYILKKYLYTVQPFEYSKLGRGIFLKNKIVDPYIDCPPE